jgi:hypothetical protein
MGAADLAKVPSPWASHRRRAEVLRERHPFAGEMLALYFALLDVWEGAWQRAREDRPPPDRLAQWAVERVLPDVVAATEAAGPEPLAKAARDLLDAGGLADALTGWLAGEQLPPVERYLARASLHAPFAALEGDEAGVACAADPAPRGDRRCPSCGGPPQLSFRGGADDPLVSGARHLLCARCGRSWTYSVSSCPSCGEASGPRRTLYAERRDDGPVVGPAGAAAAVSGGRGPDGSAAASAGRRGDWSAAGEPAHQPLGDATAERVPAAEPPVFPHLRIDACATCERYLIDVDTGRDTRAVPDVDELVALPLDLYATEHGLSKITPNLMGF